MLGSEGGLYFGVLVVRFCLFIVVYGCFGLVSVLMKFVICCVIVFGFFNGDKWFMLGKMCSVVCGMCGKSFVCNVVIWFIWLCLFEMMSVGMLMRVIFVVMFFVIVMLG